MNDVSPTPTAAERRAAQAASQVAALAFAAARREREKQQAPETERKLIAGRINAEARNDLHGKISGLTTQQATAVISAIARGEVRNVRINY